MFNPCWLLACGQMPALVVLTYTPPGGEGDGVDSVALVGKGIIYGTTACGAACGTDSARSTAVALQVHTAGSSQAQRTCTSP